MAWPLLNSEFGRNGYAPMVALGVVGYAGLCSLLRFRRVNSLQKRFGLTDRESLSRMTNEQAQEICMKLADSEFPYFYNLALQIALLKTYCIESIADLLMTVSDLRSSTGAAKRYEDTELVFAAFFKFKPDSPELHQAVGRMNFLHSSYIKTGKITNQDLLYVLGASMREPGRFMRQYEWRDLTDMEVAALGTVWKYVGDMMQIDYQTELKKDTWKDGLEFLNDVSKWTADYEDKHMVPCPQVKELGRVLLDMMLSTYPSIARPIIYNTFLVLLGERMRRAMGLDEPSIGVYAVINTTLVLRRFVVRYLMLPRMIPVTVLGDKDPTTGRYSHHRYQKEPWYVPATFWNRWSPEAIMTWFIGGQRPGDSNSNTMPEGFKWEDIGPKNKMGKGLSVAAELEAQAKARVSGGCPFSISTK